MSWIMTVSKLSYWETSSVHGEVSLSCPPRDVNQGVNSDGITKGNYTTMPLTHLDSLPSWLNLRGELGVRQPGLEINMKWKVERTLTSLHLLSFHSPVNKWNAHHSQEVQYKLEYKSVQSHPMSDKCNFVETSFSTASCGRDDLTPGEKQWFVFYILLV